MDVDEPIDVPDLWFPDGNIVLLAGNCRFKLYKGILASRSAIFRDMLSLPAPQPGMQPIEDDASFEGCPVVVLHDDEKHATHFFKAMFIPRYLPQFPQPTTLERILSCLRMSHKYDVEYLQVDALTHLSSAFTTKLANASIYSWKDEISPGLKIKDVLDIIVVADKVNAPWVLPGALLSLATALHRQSAVSQPTEYHEPSEVLETIPSALRRPFFRWLTTGRARAAERILTFVSKPVGIDDCCGTDNTNCRWLRLWATGALVPHSLENDRHPLENPSLTEKTWAQLLTGICAHCSATLKEKYQENREAEWERLPSAFGLGSWDQLEALRKSALAED
ncbi:hypothetical protein MKEN_00193900 [Mycena kentingensis (nom. inval.)]|nr:hypothetical protein MKEN_00193900 [Mycena kentingensis (nom. inval.)]